MTGSALTASPGARAHYDRRKDAGDRHAAAQRNLFGRLLGCLHRCLTTGQHYDENIAFPSAPENFPRQLDNLTASDVFHPAPASPITARRPQPPVTRTPPTVEGTQLSHPTAAPRSGE